MPCQLPSSDPTFVVDLTDSIFDEARVVNSLGRYTTQLRYLLSHLKQHVSAKFRLNLSEFKIGFTSRRWKMAEKPGLYAEE